MDIELMPLEFLRKYHTDLLAQARSAETKDSEKAFAMDMAERVWKMIEERESHEKLHRDILG